MSILYVAFGMKDPVSHSLETHAPLRLRFLINCILTARVCLYVCVQVNVCEEGPGTFPF